MLPWLMERESVPLTEVAERFGLTDEEVAADLELVSMCGLPPFVDELIDVFIDSGTVYVGVPRLFTRPLRLNAPEAFELLVAGRAAMELPGADPAGPLGRGLQKLADALGEDLTVADAVTVDLETSPSVDLIAEAAGRAEQLRITYWSASRDEVGERAIVPRQVFADRGHWYVTADDDRSGDLRTFRIDRIESITPTAVVVAPATEPLPPAGQWFADADVPRATLRLAPAATWVVERYPVDEVSDTERDGWLTVRLPVASERWLAKLLVRLGPFAEVVEPAQLRDVARQTAATVLARYGRS